MLISLICCQFNCMDKRIEHTPLSKRVRFLVSYASKDTIPIARRKETNYEP